MSIAAILLLGVSLTGQLATDEDVPRTEMVKLLQPFYRGVAARYEFRLPDANGAVAKMFERPIMSWTGEEAGLVSGDVFVWTHQGRAEVVGCIGSLPGPASRGVFHEFHSLTTDANLPPVELATGRTWRSGVPGIAPRQIPGAETPASGAARRMTQMRKLAREFSPRLRVQLQLGEEAGTNAGFDNLRLLTQPLFRYKQQEIKEHATVVDGAIFAYVWTRGTDPELLLLIEARETNDGPRWHYAPIRFTFRELWLNHRDEEVWRHPGGNGRDTYSHEYITEFERNYPVSEIRQLAEASDTEID